MDNADFALAYTFGVDDPRILPRVVVGVEFFPNQKQPITIAPIVDSGAELSVIDGSVAIHAGWSRETIIREARDIRPILGISPGPPVVGYLHEVTCYIGTGSRFARLNLRVLITEPNSIRDSVLGRDNFFRQTDITFAEADQMIYLRFRDAEVFEPQE